MQSFIVLFVSVAFAGVSAASSATWNGGGADSLASTPANWTGNAVPYYADDVIFDGTSNKDSTWDIENTFSSLTIFSYGGTITINAPLTLSSSFVPPATPASLNATPISSSRIDLSWTDNAITETGFRIERKTGADGTYIEIGAVGRDTTSYSDTDPSLTPSTTYYYKVRAYNVGGYSVYSNEASAAVTSAAPSATTNPAGNVTGNSATLNGTINPNGSQTSVYFQWGTDTSYGNTTTTRDISAGVNDVAVTAPISGLIVSTTYHFRVAATNSGGTAYGDDVSFATLSHVPPVAMTDPATNINGNSATLNATVNPNRLQTSVHFEWGLTEAYGNTTPVQSLPASGNNISIVANITGLSINTTYHYRIVAANSDGTTNGSDMTFTTPSITITITSPTDGSAINRPDAMVTGTIVTPGNETGVTVNGKVAAVYSNQFVVNHAPLTDGSNTISATATDTAGNAATTAITVTADTSQPYVTLTADAESGVASLTVNFSVTTSIPSAVSSYKMDFDGDGIIDYSGSAFDNISHSYSSPGIYYATLTVMDASSASYTDIIGIVVLNQADLDALLRSKWNAMKTALAGKDVNTAASYFTNETKQLYTDIYTALYDQLPQIAQGMQDIELVYTGEKEVEYSINQNEIYGGQAVTITYHIYFVLDTEGIWKIYRY